MIFPTLKASIRSILLFQLCVILIVEFVSTMRNDGHEICNSSDSNRIDTLEWHRFINKWEAETEMSLSKHEMEKFKKEVEKTKQKGATDRQIKAAFCLADFGYRTFAQRETLKHGEYKIILTNLLNY